MTEEKIDKDLQLESEIKFQILWQENTQGDMIMSVRYQQTPITTLVMAQSMASIMKQVLENNAAKPKNKRMKANEKQSHAMTMKLLNDIAARLGDMIYKEQVNMPDTRIKLLDKNIN